MSLLRHLLLFVLVVCGSDARSQVVSTMPQAASSESFFLYEVKLIDEFIERFNDNRDSYIRSQSRALAGTDTMISRPRMLRALFDRKLPWGQAADSFARQVCDKELYLSFADSTWYARVICLFSVGGKSVKVPVFMRIAHENGGLKWAVAGAEVSALPLAQGATAPVKGTGDFIPTSAHATNFLHLQYVFASGPADTGYFEKGALYNGDVRRLLSLVSEGRVKFIRVTEVSYHFHQVPGWVFTVEQRKRRNTNTGWLITKLEHATDAQKEALMHQH